MRNTFELCKSIFDEALFELWRIKDSKKHWPLDCRDNCGALFPWFDFDCRTYYNELMLLKFYQYKYILRIIKALLENYNVQFEWILDDSQLSKDNYDKNPICFVVCHNDRKIGYSLGTFSDYVTNKMCDHYNLNEIETIILYDKRICQDRFTNNTREMYLKDFFEMYFSEKEYFDFQQLCDDFSNKAREIIAFRTIYTLSPMNSYRIKDEISYTINQISLEKANIDDDEKSCIKERFIKDKRYEILLGKKDFAKSFITAEWLFHSLEGTSNYDYTSIVIGYFKSLEQLLRELMLLSKNRYTKEKTHYTMNLNNIKKKEYERKFSKQDILKNHGKYELIPLTDNREEFMDTSLANLCAFFIRFPDLFMLSNKAMDYLNKEFNSIRTKDRNKYIHKINLSNWEYVTNIRNDMLNLFCIVIGSYKFIENDYNHIRYINDDSFALLYEKIEYYARDNPYFKITINGKTKCVLFDIWSHFTELNGNSEDLKDEVRFVIVQDFGDEPPTYPDRYLKDKVVLSITRNSIPEAILWKDWVTREWTNIIK
ncbi:MAG: hypothetical protein IKG93_10020 [Clostridiales bacterium]|nr:hypothetical protein [Clostridiales bacterium]